MTRNITRVLGLAAALSLAGAASASVVASAGPEAIDSVEFEAKAAFEERNLGRKLSPEERQAVLASLLNQRLLVAKARAEGLHKRDEFKRALQDYERQLLAGAVYDREVGAKAGVTDAEVKAFFDSNPQLFDVRAVSQVLVQPLSAGKLEAARKESERLKAKLAAAPKSFAEVAKAESDDQASRERGGDLGTLRRGMMLPELEKAVFDAKPGSIVGPVQTQFGFHVLQVRSARKQGFEEAKEVIAKEISRARAAEAQQKLLEELAAKYKIKVNAPK